MIKLFCQAATHTFNILLTTKSKILYIIPICKRNWIFFTEQPLYVKKIQNTLHNYVIMPRILDITVGSCLEFWALHHVHAIPFITTHVKRPRNPKKVTEKI